ncbi:MAG: sigma-54-dependent Fis family transcriptional regulator [Planctomycetes bacterium]|nr:sigma-54-dependent Fis family transcriptional regulator [Planctomycetota bacterium]
MSRETVLLVEDDEAMRESCRQALEQRGFRVLMAPSPIEAEPVLLRENLDIVLTDLRMPHGGGLEVLRASRSAAPDLPVILITAYPSVESAVEAFKGGVIDYVVKPFTSEQLMRAVEGALRVGRACQRSKLLRSVGQGDAGGAEMVGNSPVFRDMLARVRQIAGIEGPVLIQGETGTGKELVARSIHRLSARSAGPFVAVNCAALPDALFEADLFGIEKGAFTGVTVSRPGFLEQAQGGMLFLDGIGDMTPAAQGKLLRCFEDKTCRRVGGTRPYAVDVRVLASSNKNLCEMVRAGRFREDIYYRLASLEVVVPPLRERAQDVPLLAVAFLDRLSAEDKAGRILGFSDEALQMLVDQPWPGNVRELLNAVRKAYVASSGPLIEAADLTRSGAIVPSQPGTSTSARRVAVSDFEREYVVEALRRHGGNVTHAARALGVHRTTLQRLMRKYGLSL